MIIKRMSSLVLKACESEYGAGNDSKNLFEIDGVRGNSRNTGTLEINKEESMFEARLFELY